MKRVSSEKFLYGVYRGVVEYNLDPLQLGRCKVRIPSLHGKPNDAMIKLLPWARPMQPLPAQMDSGTFVVPEVKMVVWVQFEGGDHQYPLFWGGFHATVQGENEVPLESLEGMQPAKSPNGAPVHEPTAWTLYKSPKGTSIGGQEAPEKESFWIIDRAGQIFKSLTFMKKGTRDRRLGNAIDGTQLDYDETLRGKVVTIFKSLGGGFIRFVSERAKEKIDLASTNKSNSRNSWLNLSSAQGEVKSMLLSEDRAVGQVVYATVNGSGGLAELRTVKDNILYASITVSLGGVSIYEWDPNDPPIYDFTKFEDTKDEVM